MYKELSYEEGLPDTYKESWESVVEKEHPLDAKPFYDDDLTRIGILHRDYRDLGEEELLEKDYLYSIYLGIDKKLEDQEMIDKMEVLDKGISILDK